jgi:signal peptide peptidase-like protein 2B
MVCSENDTSINVTIPVVMIPQSAGKKLKDFLDHGASGKLFINHSSIVTCIAISFSFYIAVVVVFIYIIFRHVCCHRTDILF